MDLDHDLDPDAYAQAVCDLRRGMQHGGYAARLRHANDKPPDRFHDELRTLMQNYRVTAVLAVVPEGTLLTEQKEYR